MKLIIAGSRTISLEYTSMKGLVTMLPIFPTEVVSGTADGVDRSGEAYATIENKLLTKFPADWDKNGKSAGYIRNKQMAEYGDALLLIWDGESRGSKNMKEEMLKLGKLVYEVILRKHNETY